MTVKRLPLLLALAVASLIAIQPAAAVTSTFKIYIDAGNDNAATSCSNPSVPFRFDEVLTTTVDTSGPTSASVTALAHQSCVAGVLDPTPDPVPGPPSPPWNVGVGNGDFGTNVVETFFKFTGTQPTTVRLALVATGATGGQDVVTTTATGGQQPIILILGPTIDIPTLGTWSLAFLALLLTLAAGRVLRRRGVMVALALILFTSAGALWAVCIFDGLINDWSAGDRVAQDNAGDSAGGPDVRSFYAKFENGSLCFRIDSTLTFNDPPTADAQAPSTNEDTALPLTLTGSDPNGDPLTFSIVSGPTSGTLGPLTGATPTSVNVTYTPNANFTGADSFVFQVADGVGGTDQATVSITVNPVDDPPVAVNDAATVNEDSGANAVNVLANDTDVDAGPISIASVTQPANGAVVITGGGTGLTYAPNANYCNQPPGTTPDTFTYTLTPGSSSATVTMTVTCVDDAPVAVADAATVVEDSGPNAVNVLANDTDIDAGPISVASVTQPANGAVVITGGGTGLTYAPSANYCNQPPGTTLDTFTYTLAPGGSSTTVTMTVTCVDDTPVAVADAATVAEDSAASAVNVLANDTDVDGGAISIASVTQPTNGAVVITGGGTGLTYAPNANYCNQPPGTTLDTFTYTLTPGSSSTTVTMTVTCVDDNPVAVADAATVLEDSGPNAVNVLANDTDIDAGPKSVASVTQPVNGAVAITGGGTGLTYAPNANYCNNPPGTTLDTFTYTLAPGSSSTTVTMTVNCVDDAPVAVADAATVVEDSGPNAINVLANDPDLDGGPKSVASVTQPANGAVVITGGGTGLTYAPNANYCNQPPGTTLDTFTYTLTPGGSVATVTATVTCVNDAPALDLNGPNLAGTGFAANYMEGDPAVLLEVGTGPDAATLSDVDNANLTSLVVTITNLFDTGFETLTANTTGTTIVAAYATVPGAPGTGTLTLTGPDTVANFQTVLRTVRYLNTDIDPDTTPRVINFVANDGALNSNTAVSTVTVIAVDTPPTAVADAATVNEDSGANAVNVLANDTDPDGGPKSVASVTQPANGSVAITGGGTGLTYAPNANYCNNP
ncbi:MAG TPA: Ig-like domain-containing protein, partial [Thermoanaerobaculia bacterium]|nr:Ig-like domain-containing protein [Thermoanaerobaculia bacterium]